MAGKALKDVTALNRCSACGHVKRAHVLCPYCVKGKPYLINNSENSPDITAIEIQNLFRSSIMYSLNKKSKPAPSSGAS